MALVINSLIRDAVDNQLVGDDCQKQLRKLDAIAEIPEWIKKTGTISEWELHYEQADEDIFWTWDENEEPTDLFDSAIYELLGLIGHNLYAGFEEKTTITQYQRLCDRLKRIGIEPPGVTDIDLSCW